MFGGSQGFDSTENITLMYTKFLYTVNYCEYNN